MTPAASTDFSIAVPPSPRIGWGVTKAVEGNEKRGGGGGRGGRGGGEEEED